MKIYIPKHIEKIGVVHKMCELLQAYIDSDYSINTEDSFNDYYYYLNTDPVKKFLHFCIKDNEDWQDLHPGEDYESVINYVSRLFYSVKGTYKVFEFMKKYLGFEITDIVYTVKNLSFTIKEVTLVDIDEKVFYDSLIDFLSALLYFDKVDIKIELINLWISNKLINYTGANIVTYKDYTTVNYDE